MAAKRSKRGSVEDAARQRALRLRRYRDRYVADELTGPIPAPELSAREASELLVLYEEALARAERRAAEAEAKLAGARIAANAEKGHKRERAVARVLGLAREGKRGRLRDPREAAGLYVSLTTGPERRVMLVSRLAEQAGKTETRESVQVPISPDDALDIVKRRCGFSSKEVARKYLERHRAALVKSGMEHFSLPRRV